MSPAGKGGIKQIVREAAKKVKRQREVRCKTAMTCFLHPDAMGHVYRLLAQIYSKIPLMNLN